MLEGKGVAIADEVRELASSGAVLVAFDLLPTNPNHTAAPFISLGDGIFVAGFTLRDALIAIAYLVKARMATTPATPPEIAAMTRPVLPPPTLATTGGGETGEGEGGGERTPDTPGQRPTDAGHRPPSVMTSSGSMSHLRHVCMLDMFHLIAAPRRKALRVVTSVGHDLCHASVPDEIAWNGWSAHVGGSTVEHAQHSSLAELVPTGSQP